MGRRPWSATSAFERRWITPEDKAVLAGLAPAQVAAEEAKAALLEKGIVAPEAAAAPEEAAAEASLMEKIKAALPKSLSKVFGDGK